MCKRLVVVLGAAVMLSVPTMLSAGVPGLVSFQGQITDSGGNPLDTTIAIGFAIYPVASGGDAVWSEFQPAVAIVNGVCDALLGSVNPIPDSVFADTARWLGITIGTSAEMSPRVRLVSGPYSFRVGTVDGASGGTIKGDLVVNGEAKMEGFRLASGAEGGWVLTSDADGKGTWQPGTPGPPGPANTLDMAYDQGGPGAGRVIEADAGPVEVVGRDTILDGQPQDALVASTAGEGRAILAVSEPSAQGDAIVAWTRGEGRAIVAHSDVTASGDAITASTSGEGRGIVAFSDTSASADVITAETAGKGRAILAYSDPTAPSDVVDAIAYGAGNAGRFVTADTSSVAAGIVGESFSERDASAGVLAIGNGLGTNGIPGIPAAAALEINNGAIRVTGESRAVGEVEVGVLGGPSPTMTALYSCTIEDPTDPFRQVIGFYFDVPIVNGLITGSSFIFLSVEDVDVSPEMVLNVELVSQTQGSATARLSGIGHVCLNDLRTHCFIHYLIVNP